MKSFSPPSARSFDGRSSVSTDDPHRNVALRGASLAFRAPPPPPKPLVNTYSGNNGALAAATRAGIGRNKNNVHTTIASVQAQAPTSSDLPRTPVREVPLKRATSSSVESLRLSSTANSSRQQSPSHIAAILAAARSTPVPLIAPLSSTSTKTSRARGQSIPAPERQDESIPATMELVQLFESRYGITEANVEVKDAANNQDVGKVRESVGDTSQSQHTRQIVSPTPIRPSVALRLSSNTLKNSTASLSIEDPGLHKPIPGNDFRQTTSAVTNIEEQANNVPLMSLSPSSVISKVPPALPPPRHTKPSMSKAGPQRRQVPVSLNWSESESSSSSYTSARDVLSRTGTIEKSISAISNKPVLPPPLTSRPSFTSRPRVPRRASSRPEIRYTTNRIIPQLTADSLANAMIASSIASSLASSRATSPIKASPSYSRSHSRSRHLFLPPQHLSRASSPTKPMRQTLRKLSTHSDDDHKKHHHYILKKHPNKHAEGDRKRWRESITERERKRYEGLWAANRGLLLDPSLSTGDSKQESTFDARECVHGLVVKDIWKRSQLAPNMLEDIWELVSTPKEGQLRREEFVVGTWLVDQCLKGRKLPVRVGDSVWDSVKGLSGVRIRHDMGRR
ncbi:Increased rDNA silencing protein [Xylographa opegraphella]|nr:Increased rDNA silencing protein [Xylographa opegraphella]